MPYTKAISPVSNSYLTKGKEYEIVWIDDLEHSFFGGFKIIDDNGDTHYFNQKMVEIESKQWQLK